MAASGNGGRGRSGGRGSVRKRGLQAENPTGITAPF